MASVLDFGAMGDGQSDDTEAIQHAIDSGDGHVEFPRGDYRITRPLVVRLDETGRTSFTGSAGTAKLIMAGAGPAIHLKGTHGRSADPLGFAPGIWKNERMPIVDGLEIEGAHPEADGIRIQGVMQPTLTRLLIREVRTAVHVTDRARNVLIDDCHFYHNTGVGVHLDGVNLHQIIISDSHISYCRLGGIRVEKSEIRNLQITGNDIEYNNVRSHREQFADEEDAPTAEIYIDVAEGTVREGTICSNTIQATYSSNGANIRFVGTGAETNYKAGMWAISGNLIGSQQNNIHLTRAWGVTITGNYIYSGHHRNLLIEECGNVVVGDNAFGHNPDYGRRELATGIRIVDSVNCTLNGVIVQDAQAGRHTVTDAVPLERDALVELVRCRRINVNGCQILDGTPVGLLLEDCHDTLVSACTVIDQREEKQMATGIAWKGSGSGNQVCHCRVGGATGTGIDAADSAGVMLSDNLI
jgi:hypothetical protein